MHVPLLGSMFGWQVTFLVIGLPGLLVALLIFLTVRDPARKGLTRTADGRVEKVTLRNAFAFIGGHRSTFVCHFLGFSFYAMVLFALMGWTPAFYIRHFELSPTTVGYMLGAVVLVANTTGSSSPVGSSTGWRSEGTPMRLCVRAWSVQWEWHCPQCSSPRCPNSGSPLRCCPLRCFSHRSRCLRPPRPCRCSVRTKCAPRFRRFFC